MSHPYMKSYRKSMSAKGGESVLFRDAAPDRLSFPRYKTKIQVYMSSAKWIQ